MDVLETNNNETLVLTGDNDNGLYLWEDDSTETRNDNISKVLEERLFLENIDQMMHDNKFEEAALKAFENARYSTFFRIISELFQSN